MSTTHSEPLAYPFNEQEGLGLSDTYVATRKAHGLVRVRMSYGEPAWLATRYDDARQVWSDGRFSRAVVQDNDFPRMAEHKRDVGIIVSLDAPDHTRLRTLIAKAFTARRIELLRPRVAEIVNGLISDFTTEGSPVDLVKSFALPMSIGVICELLGVSADDWPKFRVWTDALLFTSGLTADQYVSSFRQLREFIGELVNEHRASPQNDLMTALIEARDNKDRLSEDELVNMCIDLLIAGHDTMSSQIPNFVYTLLQEPHRWALLRRDPDRIPTAIEELLRFVPLFVGADFPRYATEDVTIGGTLIRAGEAVLVAVGAANWDDGQFAAADQLVLDRRDNHHIAFGHGRHHCIGAPLARLELQEALRALLRELPAPQIVGEIVWKKQMLTRAPLSLPIAW
jgi:cytochrome P450